MEELVLTLDPTAARSINELMTFYKTQTRADLIDKALSMLKLAAYIKKTDGELIARKGEKESKIIV